MLGLSGGEDVSWWVLLRDRAARQPRRADHFERIIKNGIKSTLSDNYFIFADKGVLS